MMATGEMAKVLRAYYDEGQAVEYRYHGDTEWRTATTPTWAFDCTDYRVAQPKPREWWLPVYSDGDVVQFTKIYNEPGPHRVHVREVLP